MISKTSPVSVAVSIAALLSIALSNSAHAEKITQQSAEKICAHHGGLHGNDQGSKGCDWQGKKTATSVLCKKEGCEVVIVVFKKVNPIGKGQPSQPMTKPME